MPPWLRSTVRITLALVGIFIVALIGTAWIEFRHMCGNSAMAESLSPDGALKAVVFDRSCGATDSGATEVFVLPKSMPLPNLKGNVFIANNITGEVYSGYLGRSEVKVNWLGSRSLQILHEKNAHISLALPAVSDVAISYSIIP